MRLSRHYGLPALALTIWISLCAWRLYHESQNIQVGGFRKGAIGTRWDPRGFDDIDRIARERESASFKDRLGRGNSKVFAWPGLKSAQVSWTWLELLQGLHVRASSEGDFSWMFSKFDSLIANSPPQEIRFILGLAPFFLVIGRDTLGANVVMNELIKRNPASWVPWFWYGYHAMENLRNYRLAGDMFKHAAVIPGSPPQAPGLAFRLTYGEEVVLNQAERQRIIESLPEELQARIRETKKDWFKE